MTIYYIIIVILLIVAILLWYKYQSAVQEQHKLLHQNGELNRQYGAMERDVMNLQRMLDESNNKADYLSDHLKSHLQLLSEQVVSKGASTITKQNAERLDSILTPLRQQIEQLEMHRVKSQTELSGEIKQMHIISQQMGHEANNLAKALTGDNKLQGNWGELQLIRLLEINGFVRDQDFVIQPTLKDEMGRMIKHADSNRGLRPDFLFNLPNNQVIVIDSKVSIKAAIQYFDCESQDKERYIAEHVSSVKKHIDELSTKNYTDYLIDKQTVPFTIMFVPNESSLSLAFKGMPTLWEYAYKRNIILASTLQIIPIIKLCSEFNKVEQQQQNIDEIIDKVSNMYDKMFQVVKSLGEVQSRFDKAQEALIKLRGQFNEGNGNLIKRVEELKSLGGGLNTTHKLPEKV